MRWEFFRDKWVYLPNLSANNAATNDPAHPPTKNIDVIVDHNNFNCSSSKYVSYFSIIVWLDQSLMNSAGEFTTAILYPTNFQINWRIFNQNKNQNDHKYITFSIPGIAVPMVIAIPEAANRKLHLGVYPKKKKKKKKPQN